MMQPSNALAGGGFGVILSETRLCALLASILLAAAVVASAELLHSAQSVGQCPISRWVRLKAAALRARLHFARSVAQCPISRWVRLKVAAASAAEASAVLSEIRSCALLASAAGLASIPPAAVAAGAAVSNRLTSGAR